MIIKCQSYFCHDRLMFKHVHIMELQHHAIRESVQQKLVENNMLSLFLNIWSNDFHKYPCCYSNSSKITIGPSYMKRYSQPDPVTLLFSGTRSHRFP